MDIQDKAFKEWFAQYDNNIEYASEKIAWDAWQAKAQAVPEGFVLVPKEPTKEMLDAQDYIRDESAIEIYKSMLAASQEPAND